MVNACATQWDWEDISPKSPEIEIGTCYYYLMEYRKNNEPEIKLSAPINWDIQYIKICYFKLQTENIPKIGKRVEDTLNLIGNALVQFQINQVLIPTAHSSHFQVSFK